MPVKISHLSHVDPRAELGENVDIGPFCFVGPDVTLGDGCQLQSHVTIVGHTTIGERNRFFPGAVIGGEPQDVSYSGAPTRLEIGHENVFREGVTVNRGAEKEDHTTRVGHQNLLMANCHVAHNCHVHNRVILVNGVLLGGHAHVHDGAIISGNTAVHHFATVGMLAFVSGGSRVPHDIPPFMLASGSDNPSINTINLVGLRRSGMTEESIDSHQAGASAALSRNEAARGGAGNLRRRARRHLSLRTVDAAQLSGETAARKAGPCPGSFPRPSPSFRASRPHGGGPHEAVARGSRGNGRARTASRANLLRTRHGRARCRRRHGGRAWTERCRGLPHALATRTFAVCSAKSTRCRSRCRRSPIRPWRRSFSNRGIAVLVEKPLAANVVEAAALVATAARDTNDAAGRPRRAVQSSGAGGPPIGRAPRYIRSERMSPYAFRSTDIGVVLDVMIHDIDLVFDLARSPLLDVEAFGVSILGENEDCVQARLRFENGCVADLAASRVHPTSRRSMQIWSESGCVSVDFLSREVVHYTPTDRLLHGESPLARARRPGADIEQLKSEIFGRISPRRTAGRPHGRCIDGRANELCRLRDPRTTARC